MPVRSRVLLVLTIGLIIAPVALISQQSVSTEPGETFCILHNFGLPTVKDADLSLQPAGVLATADDGSMWTTVSQGGANNAGAIIKMTTDGQYTKVADFDKATKGAGPEGGLVNGKNGYMYGTTYSGGKWGDGTIFRISEQGGDIEVIYDFRNGRVTGLVPKQCPNGPQQCAYSPEQRRDMSAGFPVSAPVVVGGNLYGLTPISNTQEYGTLYTIPLDTATRPDTFTATTPEDGDEKMRVLCIFQPDLGKLDPTMKDFQCSTNTGGPVFLTTGPQGLLGDATLYGTTADGNGSVFKATTDGKITDLHVFNGKDGSKPFHVMMASDGNLYGTTQMGGPNNWGVLYRINPDLVDFLALQYFTEPVDQSYKQGQYPVAGVVEGSDGQLYGALRAAGLYGRGVLYHIAKDGSNFGILHEFDSAENGAGPVNTPVVIDDKTYGPTLYGTTDLGGTNLIGTFYRMRVNRVTITRGFPLANYGAIVDVRADVTATQGIDPSKEIDHGIAVRQKCNSEPRIVQFIYREAIQPTSPLVPPGGELEPYGKLLGNIAVTTSWGDPYPITTDLKDIHWNPDAPDKPDPANSNPGSPFFEAGKSAEVDCGALTLFDRPSLPIPNAVSRAVAREYILCDNSVTTQVTWISDQTVDQNQQSHWTYHAEVSRATIIPDYFLCLLKNKGYPLPPGRSITPGYDCANLPKASVGSP